MGLESDQIRSQTRKIQNSKFLGFKYSNYEQKTKLIYGSQNSPKALVSGAALPKSAI